MSNDTSDWRVEFFTPRGASHSPADFLLSIAGSDAALITRRLGIIGQLPAKDWPSAWIKRVAGLYQLRAGDYRAYLMIDERTIVVCHICRKVSRQARREDLDRAWANYEAYQRGQVER
jgi:hypothetical protein